MAIGEVTVGEPSSTDNSVTLVECHSPSSPPSPFPGPKKAGYPLTAGVYRESFLKNLRTSCVLNESRMNRKFTYGQGEG